MPLEKRKPYRNKKILDSAKGEDCTLLTHECDNEKETTVFCHINYGFTGKGVGQKGDDFAGFYACSKCHDVYDGRRKSTFPVDDYDVLRATIATWRRLLDKGILR